ncbi:hypothetical protein V2J09_006876 [Rumex salicifolius]
MMMAAAANRKRIRLSRIPESEPVSDPFDALPDDLVICILSKLCSSASSPSDFVKSLQVCKRFNQLGVNPMVLSKARSAMFSIRAKNWSESAHRFVKQCVNAGSVEACFFLGMIRFYCLGSRSGGASLMAKAAIRRHAPSLYSLAVIQFNGSGGTKSNKDLRAGVALCARAAYLGHIDARRELGHCVQDGYGVSRNVSDGRRLLVQANALELAAVLPPATLLSAHRRLKFHCQNHRQPGPNPVHGSIPLQNPCMCPASGLECALMSDFGCNVPLPEPHPANRFLIEWFDLKGGLDEPSINLCSYSGCGRPETRPHEFRRCSACGTVKYCSRGCQAHDWKLRHKAQCSPAEQLAAGPLVAMGGQPADDMVVDS